MKKRFVWAVYSLMFAVAIILGFIAFDIDSASTWQSALLNLSTEFAGAVLIFLVVDWIFQLNEKQEQEILVTQIQGLREGIDSKFNALQTEKMIWAQIDLDKWFSDASSIWLSGYVKRRVLNDHSETLLDATNNGTLVKLLVVDPDSTAGKLMAEQPSGQGDHAQKYNETVKEARKLHKNSARPKNFEARRTSWISSCSMIIVQDKDGYRRAKIRINQPSYQKPRKSTREGFSLLLNDTNHTTSIDYFLEQFEALWEIGTKPIPLSESEAQQD